MSESMADGFFEQVRTERLARWVKLPADERVREEEAFKRSIGLTDVQPMTAPVGGINFLSHVTEGPDRPASP